MRRLLLIPLFTLALAACVPATPDPDMARLNARATVDWADALEATAEAKALVVAEATQKAEAYKRQAGEAELALIEARMAEQRQALAVRATGQSLDVQGTRIVQDATATAQAGAAAQAQEALERERGNADLERRRAWTDVIGMLPTLCLPGVLIVALGIATALVLRQQRLSEAAAWRQQYEARMLAKTLLIDTRAGTLFIDDDGWPVHITRPEPSPTWHFLDSRTGVRVEHAEQAQELDKTGDNADDAGIGLAQELAWRLRRYMLGSRERMAERVLPSDDALGGMSGRRWSACVQWMAAAGILAKNAAGRWELASWYSNLAELADAIESGQVPLSPTGE